MSDDGKETTPTDREKRRAALRLRVIDGRDICELPTPEPLVTGLLDFQSTAVLYGPSGSGKSFVALDVALSVAAGLPWQGSHITTQTRVLYVAAEGAFGMGDRVKAWEAQFKSKPDFGLNLFWLPEAVNLCNRDEAEALFDVVEKMRVQFVVVDTLARSMSGFDENSTKDMSLLMANVSAIQSTGACVLLVHHTGWSTEHARGSSALRAALDTELELKGANGVMTLKVAKQRHHADGDRWNLKLDGPDGDVPHVTRAVSTTDDLHGSALELLQVLADADAGDGLSASEWKSTADCGSESNFYKLRGRLVQRGVVVNVGSDKRPRYRVSEVGRVELKVGGIL